MKLTYYAYLLTASLLITSCEKTKPSICDCKTVFQEELPPIQVCERILNTEAKYISGLSENIYAPVERSRRECRLKWSEEIKKEFGTAFFGNEAADYFFKHCNNK